jgi:hypothetical protein|tara:strand:+ start:1018 stop:1242 length:225 start_codon:yes stop_codon:yes gene_type:complete
VFDPLPEASKVKVWVEIPLVTNDPSPVSTADTNLGVLPVTVGKTTVSSASAVDGLNQITTLLSPETYSRTVPSV